MYNILKCHHVAWQPSSNKVKVFVHLQNLMKASYHFNFVTITSYLYPQMMNYTCLATTEQLAKVTHFISLNFLHAGK